VGVLRNEPHDDILHGGRPDDDPRGERHGDVLRGERHDDDDGEAWLPLLLHTHTGLPLPLEDSET
jgi:hypothetical protein